MLDTALKGRELTRILLHELFHFAWIRLSNSSRASYTTVVQAELSRNARGELGWSAEWRKKELASRASHRFFREYICESFCDTAAWHYGYADHAEATLSSRWRGLRQRWLDHTFPQREISI